MVSFIQNCFVSLLSLKQVCGACFECIIFCEDILDSINLPDKTFAERFVLVLFQSLVNFAVGYKYTNLSKRDKNFTQTFLLVCSAIKLCFSELCFSFSARLSFVCFPRAQG